MKSPSNRRNVILTGAVSALLILALSGCGSSNNAATQNISVQTAAAARQDMTSAIDIAGTLVPAGSATVSSKVSGTVQSVSADVGQTVQAGDVLLQIDPKDLQAQLNTAQAAYNSAAGQVDLAKTNMDVAQEGIGIAQSSVDDQVKQAELAVSAAQTALDATKAQNKLSLEQAQITLDNAQTALDSTISQNKLTMQQAQSTLDNAQTAYNRQNQLFEAQAASQAAYDAAKTALDQAQTAFNMQQTATDTSGKAANNALNQAQTAFDMQQQAAVSSLSGAQSKLDSANAALNQAKGSGAQTAIVGAQGKYDAAKKQYDVSSTTGLAQAQASIDSINLQLSYTTIKAGASGVVVTRNINEGELAAAGAPLFTIADVSQLKLKGTISQEALPYVKPGQTVDVSVDIYPDKTFQGTVSSVGPIAVSTGTYFPCEITIDNGDGFLAAGVSAHATVSISDNGNIVVPNSAIVQNSGGTYLFVIENGTAVKKEIVTGLKNDTQTEVLRGVDENAAVAVSNVNALTDGMAVDTGN